MAWQKELWRPERSIAEVLQAMAGNVREIVRSEVQLAKVELKEEAAKAARVGAMLGAGIILGIYALGLLLLTCVYALATVLAPWLAALIVGVVVAAVAGLLAGMGRTRLRQVMPPQKTIETVKENFQWTKHQIK
jgi:uncharacterized membrane protein YqjE